MRWFRTNARVGLSQDHKENGSRRKRRRNSDTASPCSEASTMLTNSVKFTGDITVLDRARQRHKTTTAALTSGQMPDERGALGFAQHAIRQRSERVFVKAIGGPRPDAAVHQQRPAHPAIIGDTHHRHRPSQ
jgi:hypothetical protein